MSRSKHQFRPGALEVFETRIVPTVVPIPGMPPVIPFVPPGQIGPSTPTGEVISSGFTVDPTNTNQINSTVTNKDPNNVEYVTFAIYRAPGGGNGANVPGSGPSENLASQKLIYSTTVALAKAGTTGDSYTFKIDPIALGLDQNGNNGKHLTGDDDFQCDEFSSDDSTFSAPDKVNFDAQDIPLIVGELFNYVESPAAKH